MGARRNLSARRKNGVEFPVEVGLNPMTTQEGIVILASIMDISARVAEEAGLRESEGAVAGGDGKRRGRRSHDQ